MKETSAVFFRPGLILLQLLIAFIPLRCAVQASESPPTHSDDHWVSLWGAPGTDGHVYAMATDAAGNLYVGGRFGFAGDVRANNIAKWDGTQWSPLGSGVNAQVFAIAISGTNVFAGGDFTEAGGVEAGRIARWDGRSWSPMGDGATGGIAPRVGALAADADGVYAGGNFETMDGVAVNNVARWDGDTWTALNEGREGVVYALVSHGTGLYAGGSFGISHWDGESWSVPGGGVNRTVQAAAIFKNELIVGGDFDRAGGLDIPRIARWDGAAWHPLETGLNGGVFSMAVFDDGLVVGGNFTETIRKQLDRNTILGGLAVESLALWNGTEWSTISSNVVGQPYAIATTEMDLFIGGSLFTVDNVADANHVAVRRGNEWSSLGDGFDGPIATVTEFRGDVYAGGIFTRAPGVDANRLARWDGAQWTAAGDGADGGVLVMHVADDTLYVGGEFTEIGGLPANKVAAWDGENWSALGAGIPAGHVLTMCWFDDELYVGGNLLAAGEVTASGLATWNGGDWSVPGGFFNGTVYDIQVLEDRLYVTGDFESIMTENEELLEVNGIACWNGVEWSSLGAGLDGTGQEIAGYALAEHEGDLIVAGIFNTAGGVEAVGVARWDGEAWSSPGANLEIEGFTGWATALWSDGERLIVAGTFDRAGGVEAHSIASFADGVWSAFGTGLRGETGPSNPGYVSTMILHHSDLLVAGDFSSAGGKGANNFARLLLQGVPPLEVSRSNGSVVVLFRDLPAGEYRIERSTTLDGWGTLDTRHAGDSGGIDFIDVTAPQNEAFYRAIPTEP